MNARFRLGYLITQAPIELNWLRSQGVTIPDEVWDKLDFLSSKSWANFSDNDKTDLEKAFEIRSILSPISGDMVRENELQIYITDSKMQLFR